MMSRRSVVTFMSCLLLPLAVRAQSGGIAGSIVVPNTGITDVVVYLVPASARDDAAANPITAKVDQRDLSFVPRVVAVPPRSTVVFSNSDRVMHNVFHPWQSRDGFDLGLWAPGESRSFTFREEGAYVILCQVHPEMVGYVIVVASPYRAVTDDHGRFHFDGVAPGTYLLRTWHHRLGPHEERVTVPDSGVVHVELALKYGKAASPTAKRDATPR